MKWEKFYKKIKNNQKNVNYGEVVSFLEWLGFDSKQRGTSHRTFKKLNLEELINIQEKKGEVKPYQIKQVIKIVEKYGLMEE